MVFIWRKTMGVNAAVKVVETAVLNRNIENRCFVKFGILSIETIGYFIRCIKVDRTALSVFIIFKGTVLDRNVF